MCEHCCFGGAGGAGGELEVHEIGGLDFGFGVLKLGGCGGCCGFAGEGAVAGHVAAAGIAMSVADYHDLALSGPPGRDAVQSVNVTLQIPRANGRCNEDNLAICHGSVDCHNQGSAGSPDLLVSPPR